MLDQETGRQIDRNGLVGRWCVDGSGKDYGSATLNDGSLVGSPSTPDGPTSKTIEFASSSQYVSISRQTKQDINGSITLMAWCNMSAAYTNDILPRIVSNLASPHNGYEIFIFANNSPAANVPVFLIGNNNVLHHTAYNYVTDADRTTLAQMPRNTNVHLCGVADGTNGILYINGSVFVSDPKWNITPQYAVPGVSSQPIYVGKCPTISNTQFGGKVWDVRLYNQALSAGRIAAIARGEA